MKIIIVGGGQIGGYIAELLLENGHSVTVIENKDRALEALRKNGLKEENILIGDGTDVSVLEKAGTRNCNALVCATGLDEVNLGEVPDLVAPLPVLQDDLLECCEHPLPFSIAYMSFTFYRRLGDKNGVAMRFALFCARVVSRAQKSAFRPPETQLSARVSRAARRKNTRHWI